MPKPLQEELSANPSMEAMRANIDDFQGQRVRGGGVILNHKSLAEGTMLEVLAYPLSDHLEPKTHSQPLGRFLIQAS